MDIDKIQQFDKLKVNPPSTVTGLDDTIKELEEKKQFFLKKREEEIQNADSKPTEEPQQEEEEKPEAQANKAKRPNKKVVMNQEEFPDL